MKETTSLQIENIVQSANRYCNHLTSLYFMRHHQTTFQPQFITPAKQIQKKPKQLRMKVKTKQRAYRQAMAVFSSSSPTRTDKIKTWSWEN